MQFLPGTPTIDLPFNRCLVERVRGKLLVREILFEKYKELMRGRPPAEPPAATAVWNVMIDMGASMFVEIRAVRDRGCLLHLVTP